jgi:DNA-binding transcriptional LysR family regulator
MRRLVYSFSNLTTFAQVVATGSFSAAARKLDLSPAAVGKQIASLEQWLGARLFDRTTRHVRLTEVGREFHERALRTLAEMDDAKRVASAAQTEARGLLRISVPVSFAALHLGRAIARFVAANAHVKVDLDLDDGKVHLLKDGYDCAIRIGDVRQGDVIARRIGTNRFVLCAAPSYLNRRGEPRTPADLLEHECLRYSLGPIAWRFTSPNGQDASVKVSGRLAANNGLILCAAAIEGYGITYAPSFLVENALHAGQLKRLLPHYATVSTPIHILYPAGRHVPAKVRKLAEFMIAQLARAGAR